MVTQIFKLFEAKGDDWERTLAIAVREGRYAYYNAKNPDAASNRNTKIYDEYDQKATFDVVDAQERIFTPSPLLSTILNGGELASVKDAIEKQLNAREDVTLTKLSNGNWKYEAKKPTSATLGLKVGDIYVSTWGYEQTNVDFFQITKLIGAETAELQELEQERAGEIGGYKATPIVGKFKAVAPIRKKIRKGYDGKPYFSMEYGIAKPWSGKAVSGSSDH